MKNIIYIFSIILISLSAWPLYAEESRLETDITESLTEITSEKTANLEDFDSFEDITDQERLSLIKDLDFSENLKVWETLKIDVSWIENDLKRNIKWEIEFEWNLKWSSTKIWNIYEYTFESHW